MDVAAPAEFALPSFSGADVVIVLTGKLPLDAPGSDGGDAEAAPADNVSAALVAALGKLRR